MLACSRYAHCGEPLSGDFGGDGSPTAVGRRSRVSANVEGWLKYMLSFGVRFDYHTSLPSKLTL